MKTKFYAPISALIGVAALLVAGSAFSTSDRPAVEVGTSAEVGLLDTFRSATEFDLTDASCSDTPEEFVAESALRPRPNRCVDGAACTSNADCRGARGHNGACVGLIPHCVCPE